LVYCRVLYWNRYLNFDFNTNWLKERSAVG
jgi:hypothetical protein